MFVEHIVILLELPLILWQRSFLRFFGRKLLFAREVPKLSEGSGKRRAGADCKYCKLAGFFASGDQ